VHVFPSQWEGSGQVHTKRRCALPQITTREAGDVVRDGIEGIIVKPADIKRIAAALEHLSQHPQIVSGNGAARDVRSREFYWDHFQNTINRRVRTGDRMAQ